MAISALTVTTEDDGAPGARVGLATDPPQLAIVRGGAPFGVVLGPMEPGPAVTALAVDQERGLLFALRGTLVEVYDDSTLEPLRTVELSGLVGPEGPLEPTEMLPRGLAVATVDGQVRVYALLSAGPGSVPADSLLVVIR
jgi:hypothetical protein